MLINNSPALWQTKPQTATRLPTREKWVKRMLLLGLRESFPLIDDIYYHLIQSIRWNCRRKMDFSPQWLQSLPAIAKRFPKDNRNLRGISPNEDRIRDFDTNGDSFARQFPRRFGQHPGDDFGEVEFLEFGTRWSSEQHGIADHVTDAVGLGSNGKQHLSSLRIGFRFQQHLRTPNDGSQRVVDLMTGSCGKFRQRFELCSIRQDEEPFALARIRFR